MRARSWLAVSAGTLTGSALAITGSPQSRARPATTTAHRRRIWVFIETLARRPRGGQGGHSVHFAQTSNNGTITAGSRGRFGGTDKGGSRLSSGDLFAV